jgi:purine nucleosidase
MKTKVLLDTDIGSDIDDAVCLAYLLAQKNCDLLGITTVTGDVVKRAMIASALCKAAGKRVPIYPGSENPLQVPQLQPEVPQAAALNRWPHETEFPKDEAVEFLRRTIRQNPGEVVLLTIGPLTNIGLLFAQDPEIPRLLKSLVLMCGVYTSQFDVQGQAEWNAKLDPHASEIVYRAPVKVHRSIGLDVTMKTVLNAEEVRWRFQAPVLRPVMDFAEVWFRHSQNMIFHDPLAAATIFDENICTFERGNVQVDTQNEPGKTIWTADEAGSHQVALAVNPERFFDHYFATVGML